MGTIETEEHRRVLAAERLSAELADRNEDMPEPGDARRAAVEEWLNEHPEVVVGATLDRIEAAPVNAPPGVEDYGAAHRARSSWIAGLPRLVRDRVYFAVGDVAAHEGYVTSRIDDEWTYQELTGGGSVLYEGPSADEAQRVLDEWLRCDATASGAYCYAHNSAGGA